MADWSDFETLRNQVRYNTVDRLKHIVTGLNEQCGTHITKSGKKQDLIDRIVAKMDSWRQANAVDKWQRLRPILTQVRESGHYYRDGSSTPYTPTATSFQSRPQSLNAFASSGNYGKAAGLYDPYPPNTLTNRTTGVYDPYAPPRKIPPHPSPSQTAAKLPTIRFKPSPFFKIDTQASSVVECPESTGSTDRRSQSLTFSILDEVIQKLRSESPKYQLRLYCTSSHFYSQSPHLFRSQTSPCPTEFPPTCEVRVNGNAITANLKGMKKKPGTAPPAELPMKSLQLDHVGSNQRIDMIYVNSQQPVQVKKYYMVVFLVEVTTAEQLVSRLEKGKRQNEEEVMRKVIAHASEDDDIIVGEVKLSLKCPLTYMRIKTPCRSIQCTHPQCFDALSWFQLMEQTTNWACPVCEKAVNWDDLILDGYFESILHQIPDEEVENVLVEPNGEWHTNDLKYCSRGWREQHPKPTISSSKEHVEDVKPRALDGDLGGKTQVGELKQPPPPVYSLCDSDEEEESMITQELSRVSSPRRSSPSTRATSSIVGAANAQVIDLTLDSDEEPAPTWTARIGSSHQLGDKRKRRPEDNGRPSPERRLPTPVMQNGLSHLRGQTGAGSSNGLYGFDGSRPGDRYDSRAYFQRLPGTADALQLTRHHPASGLPTVTPGARYPNTLTGSGEESAESFRG